METHQVILLIVYILMIFMSAFFSAAETAFSAANIVRLRTLESNGNKKAQAVLKMMNKVDRIITTLLVGNNIVNITAATLATVLFSQLLRANIAATISTIVTTVLLLIFGEITPKILAKEKPEGFCMNFYPVVKALQFILTPINFVFTGWKKLLKKIFRLQRDAFVTGDELKTYVETAKNEGEITELESDLIRSAIEFDDLAVYDVMTPRVNLIAIEENESADEIAEKFFEHGYSRLPVYSKSLDSITGILHEKDFYYMSRKSEVTIKNIVQNTICVSGSMKISAALRLLQKAKIHMAVVVDEFGGTSGIITLEDILEELVGEIWDEHDEEEILLKKLDDNSFLVSGSESLDSMFEALGLDVKEEFEAATVGGWVTEQMEKIPVAGEKFEFSKLIFTVTKATVKKVVEVRVKLNSD